MRVVDIEVSRQERHGAQFATVTFRGDRHEGVAVRLRVDDDTAFVDREAIIRDAKVMLLETAAVEEGRLSDPDPVAEGETLEQSIATDEEAASLEEEDDNPYQEADEALPDDREESVLAENPTREERKFGEA